MITLTIQVSLKDVVELEVDKNYENLTVKEFKDILTGVLANQISQYNLEDLRQCVKDYKIISKNEEE